MPVTSPSSLAAAMASYIQQTTPSPPPPQAEVREASFAANLQDLSAPARAGDSAGDSARSAEPMERPGPPLRREAPNPPANRPPPPGSLFDITV